MPTRPRLIQHPRVVVLSDLHLADPRSEPGDEFDREEDFRRLLDEVVPQRVGWPATLVLAGDFIDFTRVLPELGHRSRIARYGATQQDSLDKLQRVIAGHPGVFAALRVWLERGGQVLVLPGNHDVDFHWPAVFAAFASALGNPGGDRLQFVKAGAIHEQGVRIEHGNQQTFDNRFEHWNHPILQSPDGPRLERPWGSLFMELAYTNSPGMYPFLYRVLRRGAIFRILMRSLPQRDGISWQAIRWQLPFFLHRGSRLVARRFWAAQRERFRRRPHRGMPHRGTPQEDVRLLVRGHTHRPLDGVAWSFGDPPQQVSLYNAGCWLPQIPLSTGERPRWRDLRGRATVCDLRYVVVDLDGACRARLERLQPARPSRRPAALPVVPDLDPTAAQDASWTV